MRLSKEQLDMLCEKYHTDRLNSWSRLNSIDNSMYEYYLNYVLHIKPDRANSIYVVTGGLSHDILEKFYNKELEYKNMENEFEDAWMTAFDISELKFDRSDSDRNNIIAGKYHYDLQHFFKNHKVINDPINLEEFVLVKVGDEYYQGYIDAKIHHTDDTYTILDWKTSSIYTGAKKQQSCGQLVMYAMALHQQGIPYEKIKIAWNFLKYVNITVSAKNGTQKIRAIERYEIGTKLQANAKMWLKHFGYEDCLDEYLDALLQTNDISVLPKEVQDKYEVNDCYVYVDLTPELIQHWETYIVDTMKFIRNKEHEYKTLIDNGMVDEADKIWWESEDDIKKQSYYFSNLCGYSANLHKPYKAYLEKLDAEKNQSLVGGKSKQEDEYAEDDLSWLNSI